jgi:hypothetical protein
MSLYRRADPIRLIAVRLGHGELQNITQEPGVHEALRVSIFYEDGRAPNSVATIKRGLGSSCALQLAYDKEPEPVYFNFNISVQRYQETIMALRRAGFDRLDDQTDVPYTGVDLWLVERIAGSFYHDIILCPNTANGNHREVMVALKKHLPEAIHQGAG